MQRDRPTGPVPCPQPYRTWVRSYSAQSFLLAAAAASFTASLVACLASPTAFWPLPLTSLNYAFALQAVGSSGFIGGAFDLVCRCAHGNSASEWLSFAKASLQCSESSSFGLV